ncbi:MAG: carbohydrate kinase [Paracoccaceae bacterium]|nr:carbohydrate kinase [Paracoccaceae bacterium]
MLVVGGENLIDLVSKGSKVDDLPTYVANPGGSPYNVAIAASRQGQEVSYLTPISEDALGVLLASRLLESGVHIAASRVSNPTSLAVVSLTDGIPSYSFHRNDTAERQVILKELKRILPKAASVLHLGSLGLIDGDDAETWEIFFKTCHERGLLTTLDPNVRPGLIKDRKSYVDRIFHMMEHTDIFKLSDEDLTWLFPNKSFEGSLKDARSRCSAALFIITMGSKGARGFVGNIEIKLPAVNIPHLVDTVGAGDTFMATVLAWIIRTGNASREAISRLKGKELTEVMKVATIAASVNCQRAGCNPPFQRELALETQKNRSEM